MDLLFYGGPLLAGIMYAFATMALKRAFECGARGMHSLVLSAVADLLVIGPLFLYSDEPWQWSGIEKPLLVSLFLFFGAVFVLWAIRISDVTVQAPLMGSKILFVAGLAALFGIGKVESIWWIAAGMASLAVFMLGLSYGGKRPTHWLGGAACTVAACALFALEDVWSQQWAPGFGSYNFLVVVVSGYAISSLALMGFVRGTWRGLSREAWLWLIGGTAVMALQNVIYSLPIVLGGQATVVNILYSSRGLWSIVFVWFMGHWFQNKERQTIGGWHMLERALGAILMFGAIVCVLM